jgi:hypothetical protein
MPKMTHWNSPEPVNVRPEKVAVYQAQGWTVAGKAEAKVTAMTTDSVATAEASSVEPSTPKPAKKAAAKKTAAKKK